ncbi:hypothetical protein [Brachyspira hyodysenteriae]|uniref:hypothetical protein n=1 Tax=Brachyspira hyodysenteriae TaxID=159 RepID=UPI00063DB2DF|nr:hypothetical protein [Brachyspira hyodysenteriae]KLI18269.1 hypothetical protein SU45_02955 [Brachyspira hyodysenteriae]KLI22335.1 hypothetical protein SU43_08470 [Brachyspira hyodysenteriae]KLI62695.1 hypothetical protein SZ46_00690 [Brachyspira hyodysenteriae]TVL62705.1 hypothetical protein A9X85_00515 [Brachyspira hyodysenteriae]TVL80394.1 hypothetical protein A9X82_02145 [Brachyspira hyodysenteriae]
MELDKEKEKMLNIKYHETKENIKIKIAEILTGIKNINIDLTPFDIRIKIKDEIIIWASLDAVNNEKVTIKYSYDKIYLTENIDDSKFELYRNIFNAFDLLRKDNIKNKVSKILEKDILIMHDFIFDVLAA